MLARFRHLHIVQVHRVFETGGTAYMVMEHVEGRTLASLADAEGPLGESRVREVLEALTDGLSSVHAAGLLHRDISPDNVMLRPDGQPVLIDFGAARQGLGEHSGALSSVLKPGYAPLEQYPPGQGQGPWTDIYGLGALAYWALSGARPTAATERTRRDPLRPLSEVAARDVSSGLSSAVEAALSVYPEDRPQSLDEWRKLLHGGAGPGKRRSPRGGEAGVEGVGTTVGGSGPSRRRWPAAALTAGLAAAALAAAWLTPGSRERPVGGSPASGPALTANRAGGTAEPAAAGSTGEEAPAARGGGAGSVSESENEDGGGGGAGAAPGGAAPAEEEPAAAGPPPDEVERGLGLDRAAWREIQEGLTASGFDPGAADGLVGGATRSALRAWQSSRGAEATGYADAEAVSALREAADDAARVADQRRAELEAAEREAEAQRQAELATEREAEARRQAELAAEREAEARRQAELAAEREAEARRQAELAAEREAEAQRRAEEARQAELAAEAERRRPGRVFRDCDVCPEMVVVPAGTFRMGCGPGNDQCRDSERPAREVEVASFALAKYEVTQGQFAAFVRATGHDTPGGCFGWGSGSWRNQRGQSDGHPVVCVNWDDAQAYVRWLSGLTGQRYRLPSEAEWEYAARGATTTRWYWGNRAQDRCELANGGDRDDCDDGWERTAPVGTFPPNGFGLYDMAGNVWEWVEDCWHQDYGGAPPDGSAWTRGCDSASRIIRGGSWFNRSAERLRPGARDGFTAGGRRVIYGFRVSRTLD